MEACVGRWKSIVVVLEEYNVAVASSKDGLMEWSDSGLLTVNSISLLTSACIVVVGKAIVHLLCCECS